MNPWNRFEKFARSHGWATTKREGPRAASIEGGDGERAFQAHWNGWAWGGATVIEKGDVRWITSQNDFLAWVIARH